MAGRDDGEFELILGNKQLLSVLFLVIVLLGVFFAMGFLAGRTTGPLPATAQKPPQEQQPLAVDSASVRQPAPAGEKTESTLDPPAGAFAAPATSEAAKAEPAPAPKSPAPVETKADAKADTKKAAPAKPVAAPPPPPAKTAPAADQSGFAATPPPGSYLQAAATRRPDAEAMLIGIRNKTGLTGYVTPVPKNPELFRVVIGPLATKAEQAAARAKLNEIGVKSPYPVKY